MSPKRAMRGAAAWRLIVGGLLAAGCHSCDEERPYTPFSIPSSAIPSGEPTAPAPRGTGAVDAGGSGFSPAPTLEPTAAFKRRWKLGERTLNAPEGQLFDRAFAIDPRGGRSPEVVAWTTPERARPDERGTLWLFGADGPPKVLARTPAFVPTGSDCEVRASLAHSGPRSATVQVTASCQSALIPRSPVGALLIANLDAAQPEVLTLRVAEAAPGESVRLTTDTTDRDGDGREDVRVHVELKWAEGEKPAHAELLWLDRAAGLAREPHEPATAFRDQGSVEVVRAKGKNTSVGVRDRVDGLLRLYSTLCAEAGVPRLFDQDGAPLGCGDLEQAFEWYADAVFTAALTKGRPLEALSVLLRDGWYGHALGDALVARLRSELRARVAVTEARAVRLGVRARQRTAPFQWAPLRFEQDGTLLVMTPSTIARFGPRGEELGTAEEEVDPWPLTVIGPDGVRHGGVAFSCDRNEAVFVRSAPDGAPLPSATTNLLAPRPGGCAGERSPEPGAATPVLWNDVHQQAILAGAVVVPNPDARPGPPAAPVAIASPLGLFVTRDQRERAALWTLAEAAVLGQCVLHPDGARAACVTDDGTIRLITPAP